MTTNAAVNLTADSWAMVNLDQGSDRLGVSTWDFDRVHVSFPAEDGGDTTCKHCGVTIVEDDDPSMQRGRCWREESWDDDRDYQCGVADDGLHEPDDGPGSWCNSASVSVDEDENAVHVSISVGDPRGAFVMTVRQVDRSGYCTVCGSERERHFHPKGGHFAMGHTFTPDGMRLMLHVPDPSNGFLHMPLTKLHDGTFMVG